MGRVKKLIPWIVCILVDLLVVIGVWSWGYLRGKAAAEKTIMTRTDTVKVKEPVPAKESRTGTVTVPVRVVTSEPKEHANFPDDRIVVFKPHSIADSARNLTYTASNDTVRAIIPITQKEYRDSDYSAWVSGYMPKLDSIQIYRRTLIRTQTVTKRNRFSVGIVGGYGYGFLSHRAEPFVGVGVAWNLFR